jgi:chaperonin GroEL
MRQPVMRCSGAWKSSPEQLKGTLGPSGRNVMLDKNTVVQPSRKTGLPWRRKSCSRTPAKTWELNWSARWLPRPQMLPVMAQRPRPFWPEAIFREGLKNVTAGANPTSLQRGIMQAVEAIVEELKKISKKVSNRKEIAQVATVSFGRSCYYFHSDYWGITRVCYPHRHR